MRVKDSVAALGKIFPTTLKLLKSIGIITIADLLQYYPRRYLDFSQFTEIKDLRVGETVTIKGTIKSIQAKLLWTTKRNMAEAIVSDSTGSIHISWFNQGYIAKTLKAGDEVFLSGKVDQFKGLQMANPVYEKLADHQLHTGRLVPVYSLPDGLYNRSFRTLIDKALGFAEQIPDIIPLQIRVCYRLPNLANAIRELHFPTNKNAVTKAQERLAFEEALVQQLAVLQHKQELRTHAAPNVEPDIELIKKQITKLPFSLTDGQKRALWDICKDLQAKHPMNRLLMGDVGSGKTIVALLAAMQVISKGFQVALLAPTEVLAKQHFDGITKMAEWFFPPPLEGELEGVVEMSENTITSPTPPHEEGRKQSTGLLTRNFHLLNSSDIKKSQLIKRLAEGKIQLIIGTHALLQESIKFKNLAFVIIDEQHRFGVSQRGEILKRMGEVDGQATWTPHLLSMTATPIPRTAALTLYGDLEVSTINKLPKNRLPIKTWVVPEEKRAGAYEFIQKEIVAGRQAFVITPLVEESERLQVKSVKLEFEHLQKNTFPHLKMGLIYGSMKGADKDKVMMEFRNREINILVATSVIEIGIDIPNASIILIEGAERFGLAQLHQLRGRVGRGVHQSYCLLFTTENPLSLRGVGGVAIPTQLATGLPRPDQSVWSRNDKPDRLSFFSKTSDGFKLAEYDLKTRGFGSLFGTKQTGFDFKYGQYLTLKVLQNAKHAAQELTKKNPNLNKYSTLKKLSEPLSKELHLE